MVIAVKTASVKMNTAAPFGSGEERFKRYFLHPALDRQGIFNAKPRGCDPGLYRPQSMKDAFEINKNRAAAPWACKKNLEEWAKNLGYRNQKILDYKAQRRAALGPAWHSVAATPQCPRSARGDAGFGTVRRFRSVASAAPGPATYPAPPAPRVSAPHLARGPRCRFRDAAPPWALAPNRYRVVDADSIAHKPLRGASRRGPYDLFTGERDGTTIRNHFADNARCAAATWPLAPPDGPRARRGAMRETGRERRPRGRNALTDAAMCYRRPSEPGPAAYGSAGLAPRPHARAFDGMGAREWRGPGVWPAVGRYTVARCARVPGGGHVHVFRSKVPRTIGALLPQPMNSF